MIACSTFSESEPHQPRRPQMHCSKILALGRWPGRARPATPGRDQASAAEGRGPGGSLPALGTTAITFDDLPAGTHEASDQQQAAGCRFHGGVPPERRPGPGGASPIGDHGRQHPAYTAPSSSYAPGLGDVHGTPPAREGLRGRVRGQRAETRQLTMRAYDANHNLIAQSNPADRVFGAGFHTPLEASTRPRHTSPRSRSQDASPCLATLGILTSGWRSTT